MRHTAPSTPSALSGAALALPLVLALAADAPASQFAWTGPDQVVVALTPGDPVEIPVSVRVPEIDEVPLDLVLLQAATFSFADDLLVLADRAAPLARALDRQLPDLRLGLASYTDKPLLPFGSRPAGDYVYRTDLPLSAPQHFGPAARSLRTVWGRDRQDAQLEALMQLALRASSELGFRADSRGVAVVTLDTLPHLAGDLPSRPANDGDVRLAGDPAGAGEDYPSLAQVRAALVEARLVPLFAVAGGHEVYYRNLVADLGFGASVVLESDGANLEQAISDGLDQSRHVIEPRVAGDAAALVAAIDPPLHDAVAPGETRTFLVTLAHPGVAATGSIELDTGFGTTTIYVAVSRCSDGLDNDGDGDTDWGEDDSCGGAEAGLFALEETACSDGIDNDGDGLIDYPLDPGCLDPTQWSEDRKYCGLLGIEPVLAWALACACRRHARRSNEA